MKKLLLALPLVAGASWAGSTYYAGTQAQPAYQKLLTELNAAASEMLVLEEANYTTGFTQSTAVTNVTFLGFPDNVLFQLKHDIQHTPIGSDPEGARFSASSINTTLVKESIAMEELRQIVASFDGGEPFTLYTDVGFTGTVVSDLQISSLSLQTDDGEFAFDGGRYEATSINGKIDINGLIGQLAYTDNTGNAINVAGSSANFDLQQVGIGVYTGEQGMTFPSLSYTSEVTGIDVTLEDIVFDSTTSLTGDKLNSEGGISIAAINSPLPLNSIDWAIAMNGISVDGLENYISTMNKLMDLGAEQWQDPDTIDSSITSAYKGLISPGAEFTNKLILTNDGGDVIGDVNVSFLGDGSANGMDSMATLGDLLQAITLNIELDADAPAIDLTPAAMLMMHPMAQQYILSDGQKYTSNISVANLMLDVNGNQQPLEFMLGDELNAPLDSAMADY